MPTFSCLVMLTPSVLGQSSSRYHEMLASSPHAQTVKSVGMLMLALPHERDNVQPQIEQYIWVNHRDADIGDASRELAVSRINRQLDQVERLIARHDIRTLRLIGFSEVGTIQNLDLYYGANTSRGPVVFRTSIYFADDDAGPRVFDFEIFEGWEEVRGTMEKIHHRAGRETVTISINPDNRDAPVEAEPDKTEMDD